MSLGAPELATKEYWDARYQTDDKDGYDWFKTWSELSDFFRKHLTIESRILILGCGTSSLSEELYNAGYKHITSMDFSPVAINLMKERHAGRTEMKWDVMDIRDLAYSDESFDVAIDVSMPWHFLRSIRCSWLLMAEERYYGCHVMLQRKSLGSTGRRCRKRQSI